MGLTVPYTGTREREGGGGGGEGRGRGIFFSTNVY